MSQREFAQLLESLPALSTEQLEVLRLELDRQLSALLPTAESAFDVLSRAGLIGSVEGAAGSPDDLATNPAHMLDFGRE